MILLASLGMFDHSSIKWFFLQKSSESFVKQNAEQETANLWFCGIESVQACVTACNSYFLHLKQTMSYDKMSLYHFDSIFLIPVTVFPTRFPHKNLKKRHYETNIIPYFATFENSWEKLIIRANFWVIRGLTPTHDPKI